MQFADLRLSEPLLRAVRATGYTTPTPIQANAIPIILEGRDVLGCAQTGTGKTAAFALPVLQRLSESAPSRKGIRALVLCPTRELAQQIHDSFTTYGAHTGTRPTVIFGGVNQNRQVRAIRAGADIVIATPGRLLDLMNQGLVSLGGVEMLVLDEADRMLDMGFLPDIRRILAEIPRERQTLLFSATMPTPIRSLANDILRNPVPVQVARVSSPVATVEHWVYHVERPQKVALLVHLLSQDAGQRALVFTRTKHGADKLTKLLGRAGVRAAAIHGNKTQSARTRALEEFRSAETPVLVATDIAARGLDVDDIRQVINYDLTPEPETYVHRIGRTGRAGASGKAVSFCTADERGDLRAIERLLRTPLQHVEVPTLDGEAIRRQPQPTAVSQRNTAKPTRPRHARATTGRGAGGGPRRRRRGRSGSARQPSMSAKS